MAATAPEQPAPMAPRAVPRHAAQARDERHLDARARARLGRAPVRRARAVHDALRLRGRRGADLRLGPGGRALVHTVRAVGAVTEAICAAKPGTALGVRGPLGNAWPLGGGGDMVVIAGGIGLAPLRGVVYELVRRRGDFGEAALLYGSRTPAELLYPKRARALAAPARRSTSPSTRPIRAGRARSASSPSSSARLASTRASRRRLSAARRS